MMHAKANTVGMTQRVSPFLDWLRATTVEPQQGIAALTRVDLVNSTMAQRQGIRTSLVPPPPPPLHHPSHNIPLHQPFHLQAPAPPPAHARQGVAPAERWGTDLRSLLLICNAITAVQLPEIWRTVAPLKNESARAAMEAACWRTTKNLRF